MTKLQFRRWYGFALRMARYGFRSGKLPRRSVERVEEMIRDFFRDILDDDKWYAEHHGKGMIERIVDWDHSDDEGIDRNAILYGAGDRVTLMLEERYNPFRYSGPRSQYDRWDELWGNRVRCCIRAGLDLAGEPSAGVFGFTVGGLRRMYKRKIPDWIVQGLVDSKTKQPIDLNSRRVKDLVSVGL